MGWIPNLWHREEISFFVQFQHGGTRNNYEVVITRNSYDDSRSRVPGAEQNKGNLEGEDLNAFLVATARTRLKDPAAEPSDDVSRIFRKSGRDEGTWEATSQRDPVLISCRGEKPKTPEQRETLSDRSLPSGKRERVEKHREERAKSTVGTVYEEEGENVVQREGVEAAALKNFRILSRALSLIYERSSRIRANICSSRSTNGCI